MTSAGPENCETFLKALADKTRWQIVQELLAASLTVGQIARRLRATHYNVSKHLRVLRETGIVEAAKQGRNLLCQIVPAFRGRAAKDKLRLDLGCCVFHFARGPRKSGSGNCRA